MALVNPDMLGWSRESAGYTLERAAAKLKVPPGRLSAAEEGSSRLTLRQAEALADLYRRPLATFYLPMPPVEPSSQTQKRQLPDAPSPPWSAEMTLLVRRMRDRQNDARELYGLLDEVPPWMVLRLDFDENSSSMSERVRGIMSLSIESQHGWNDGSRYTGLRECISAVEQLGVIVFQESGIHLHEARGLASVDDQVPAIFLHTKDDPGSRLFTLMHELGHLLRSRAVSPGEHSPEKWCNGFAANFLMPAEHFSRTYRQAACDQESLIDVVDHTARAFGVTPRAALVRLDELGLISANKVAIVQKDLNARAASSKDEGSGGDYYRTAVARLGRSFARLVFAALDAQAVSYSEASALLSVKVNNFAKLRTVANAETR